MCKRYIINRGEKTIKCIIDNSRQWNIMWNMKKKKNPLVKTI